MTTESDPRPAVRDLVGVLAYGELTAFERLAADAQLAPSLADKAALAGMAVAEFGHFARLRDYLAELGTDPDSAMAPFAAALDAFHRNTAPADWLESLVKAYVGDGIAADFYREIAGYCDPRTGWCGRCWPIPDTRRSWWSGCVPRSPPSRHWRAGFPCGRAGSWGRRSRRRSAWWPTVRRSPTSSAARGIWRR